MDDDFIKACALPQFQLAVHVAELGSGMPRMSSMGSEMSRSV